MTPPVKSVSVIAPAFDDAENHYFAHHYYDSGTIIEADIYVAMKMRI